MRPIAVKSAIVVTFACTAWTVWAATDKPGKDVATELFRLSGLQRQIAAVEPGVQQAFLAQGRPIPEADRAEIAAVIGSSFSAKDMQSDALAHLKERMDRKQAEAALAWLRTPTGVRITGFEEAASEPEAMQAMQSFAFSLQSSPPDAERVVLVQRLDAATGTTELTTEVMFTMARAAGRAFAAALPNAGSLDELEATLEQQRPLLEENAQNITLVSLLFAYRELSIAELSAYVSFLETPAGRWYQEAAGGALRVSLTNAVERLAIGLAEMAVAREGS